MRKLVGTLIVGLALSATGVAAAQEVVAPEAAPPPTQSNYPIRYVDRPLTLASNMLRIDVAFQVTRLSVCVPDPFGMGGEVCAGDEVIGLPIGAAFGIMDDLEVGATVLPLVISPDFDYGNPNVYAMYRILRGDMQLGAMVNFVIPVQEGSDPVLGIGVPLWIKAGALRIETGAQLSMTFGDSTVVGLLIPVGANYQIMDNFFAGLGTGLGILSFEHAGDTMYMPLDLHAGYTLAGNDARPLADITVAFGFPAFLDLSAGETFTELWQLTVGGRVYLGF